MAKKEKAAKKEAAPVVEKKTSGKGVRSFVWEGHAKIIRDKFSGIYANIPKANLEFRGKKDSIVAKKTFTKKDGTKETKEFSGEEAKRIATERYYSHFGTRLQKRQNPERNKVALEALRSFLTANDTVESQARNGQAVLDVLMEIYKEPRAAGTGGAKREKKVKGAVSLEGLDWE